jgi:uncharacterized protein (DUF1684 family)
VAQIAAARLAKDEQFLRDKEPVPEAVKSKLIPLEYFPIDERFSVPAALKLLPRFEPVELVTSTGSIDKYDRVGHLEFVVGGQQLRLAAYVPAGQNVDRLFVPFSDQTSGNETYTTGRYLDLDRTPTGLYQVDFNLAYNPYCYFSPSYICPVPTEENRLPVRIEAGEKVKSET